MNCHRVQKLLSSYLDQELSAEERREIRKHLFACAPCSRLCDELTLIKDSLEGLEPPAIGGDFLRKVHLYREGRLLQETFLWGKRLAMAAVWILLFLLTSFLLFPNSSGPELAKKEEQLPDYGARERTTLQQEAKEESTRLFLPRLPGIPVSR
ncbi:MAG: zf-HC2 domain-containing protein [Firmicutes bacterium]|nr:zf-HC2 domain-containing protein [Bacillota bacterium]